jgi:hypothetical protein
MGYAADSRDNLLATCGYTTFTLPGGSSVVYPAPQTAKVEDEVELHQMILDMPFTPFSDVSVTPTVNADVALPMAQERIAKVMEMMAGKQ